MSVFTRVDRAQLERFLQRFDVGELVAFKGISEGIENTNYFVTTTGGEFVLTLIEQWPADEVPFFLDLMAWLSARGFPSARPMAARDGSLMQSLNERPTALVERLAGESTEEPTGADCEAVGSVLAQLHRAAEGFPQERWDRRGMAWRKQTAARLDPVLEACDHSLLTDEIAFQCRHDFSDLPRGVIHADLFPDNVLFKNGVITGVIDFYYACTDLLVYDVAVTVNQWCSRADGSLEPSRARRLLHAYNAGRPLLARERDAWIAMLRYAALRYWLSRLKDKLFPKQGHLTTIKDPDELRVILTARRAGQAELLALWDEVVSAGPAAAIESAIESG
ncbi:MAG: homoserine kinase [Gammaproteobacteria bacterium]|nr:homoserine kinase [Gammaproteobacteria bacterium]